jgi:hypothetical protein
MEPNTWLVSYVSDLMSPAEKVSLATISLSDVQFYLGWKVPLADIEIRRQLANCRLQIIHGSEVCRLQLRRPHRSAPIKLDMNSAAQLIEFPVLDLPSEMFH